MFHDYALQQVDAFNANLRSRNFHEALFRLAMAASNGINTEKLGEMCERFSTAAKLKNQRPKSRYSYLRHRGK